MSITFVMGNRAMKLSTEVMLGVIPCTGGNLLSNKIIHNSKTFRTRSIMLSICSTLLQ